jgi:hypothetical protein
MWKYISSKLSRRKSGAALATLIGGGSLSYFTPKLLSHHGPQPLLAKEEQPVKSLQLLKIELLIFLKDSHPLFSRKNTILILFARLAKVFRTVAKMPYYVQKLIGIPNFRLSFYIWQIQRYLVRRGTN